MWMAMRCAVGVCGGALRGASIRYNTRFSPGRAPTAHHPQQQCRQLLQAPTSAPAVLIVAAGHAGHALRSEALYNPAVHISHANSPSCAVKNPEGHAAHAVCAVAPEYNPAGHKLQLVCCSASYRPASHMLQRNNPAPDVENPDGQSMHSEFSSSIAYVPD